MNIEKPAQEKLDLAINSLRHSNAKTEEEWQHLRDTVNGALPLAYLEACGFKRSKEEL